MESQPDNLERFTALFHEVLQECGEEESGLNLKLYDLEYLERQKLLRVYIYRPETKSALIDDCILVDRLSTPFFENNEWIPEDITLEVSSPGLYRTLKTETHYEMAIGEEVEIFYRDTAAEENKKTKVQGILTQVSGQNITLEVAQKAPGSRKNLKKSAPLTIERDTIIRGKLCPQF